MGYSMERAFPVASSIVLLQFAVSVARSLQLVCIILVKSAWRAASMSAHSGGGREISPSWNMHATSDGVVA